MADSTSSSSVNTNLPDATSARSDHVPVQVTTVQLNKENYSRWSPAITMGIAGRGRIAYVNGRKVEPAEDSMAWDTWYLEDNQIRELRAYLSKFDVGQADTPDEVKINQALAVSGGEGTFFMGEWIVDWQSKAFP
ncbi:hypothetical protein EJ110_NYTH31450 [Nymphaea thermarum]|nr:hypothetical protein EJ110_NYTH31450 [Nymphaea thermarum]